FSKPFAFVALGTEFGAGADRGAAPDNGFIIDADGGVFAGGFHDIGTSAVYVAPVGWRRPWRRRQSGVGEFALGQRLVASRHHRLGAVAGVGDAEFIEQRDGFGGASLNLR